ncbi:hypothetical protein KIL84_018356 [Mauremys mutica]|uniref:Uncharacterized protein n=1 Tax=Mauremys mutica TaxID=74926 RepID=A0A9D4B2C4_9SAUR|nr:hypothetical protein KIL84_018356 [Mauremys mutica]
MKQEQWPQSLIALACRPEDLELMGSKATHQALLQGFSSNSNVWMTSPVLRKVPSPCRYALQPLPPLAENVTSLVCCSDLPSLCPCWGLGHQWKWLTQGNSFFSQARMRKITSATGDLSKPPEAL